MKILHFITSLKIGGAEQALCNMLALLQHQGFQHHVAYFYDGPHVQTLHKLGIPTYQIKGLFHHYDPIALLRLKKLIRHIKPDVLHTSLWSANIIGRLLGRMHKIPVVCDLHGNCTKEGFIRNMLDRLTAAMPYRTVAVADAVGTAYKQHILPARKHTQLVVIKNGIDVDRLHAQAFAQPLERADLGLEPNAFIVGAIGRLEPIKSYDVLIRAFAQWCNATTASQPRNLVLVGDGSQTEKLKDLVRQLGIAQLVIFVGARTDACRFYPLFNCFALSSQSEGLSLALLEAMSFGLPVISTSHLQHHDVIEHSINGLLVPSNDVTAYTAALKQLYDTPLLRHSMSAVNKKIIDKQYRIQRVVEQYRTIFTATAKSSDCN